MTVDLKTVEKTLAEYKVYDAWQYVTSLCETLCYMNISYGILVKVHDNRVSTLKDIQQEKMREACKNGSAQYNVSDLKRTNLDVGGYEIDDIIYLRKTAMEFFHYGRMSLDVLFQIVNAALLGDDAFSVEDKCLLKKLLKKLGTKQEFANLLQLMDSNKNDTRFEYLMAFDNYMKHIKTILITVKNSILIGNENIFELNAFSYNGVDCASENALDKIQEIHDYVLNTIDVMLNEIMTQVPNCLANSQRIQEIHYKQVFTERDKKSYIEYISFFIDVPTDISDLPAEIKVYPLIVKPNNEIYNFDFRFDKIFIRKNGSDEENVVGMATIKNSVATNEFYRVYEVQPCQQVDYSLYVANFKTAYAGKKLHMNLYAMDGVMHFINADAQKTEPELQVED